MSFIDNVDSTKKTIEVPEEKVLNSLIELCDVFAKSLQLNPPVTEHLLLDSALAFIKKNPEYSIYKKLVAILINNSLWESYVATIPFNRRVLLLPRCIQNSKSCNAKMDELGLLCELCGGCNLTNYITKAEKLGYNVIVSEGSGAVSVLLNSGQIECVIGVACIDSFERTFPISLKQAIPAIAIPLYNSDCKDSKTNEPWLMKTINLNNNLKPINQVDLKSLRKASNDWFSLESLNTLIPFNDKSNNIAKKWLMAGGKRWRPLILASVYKAISGNDINTNTALAKLAVAIESFHKASLAHDDIVDNDTSRYGDESLFNEHSLDITLNTGDLLVSYGYELIALCGLSANKTQHLLRVASKAHRELCTGQGEELLYKKNKQMPNTDKVIDIFKLKTAPAFEVSMAFGAIMAESKPEVLDILSKYSEALGIAYQINDDIDDFNPENLDNDISDYRPSIILALLKERKQYIVDGLEVKNLDTNLIYEAAKSMGVIGKAEELLEEYRQKALGALDGLDDVSLKILLYRLTSQILG